MKKIAFYLIATGVFFAACRKETTFKQTASPEKKVQSVHYSSSTGTAFSSYYAYDNTGKLKELKHKNETETFTYSSPYSFAVKTTNDSDPTIFTTDIYTLNNKGAVEKMETLYANGSIFSITRFTYDTDNILKVRETEYPQQNKIFRFEYSITDKLKTAQRFFINNVLQSREEYSYDISRPLKGLGQLNTNNYFPGLYGEDQQFPLAGIKFFDAAGNLQENRSYTSVHDEQGYIISYSGNNLISNNTFTCQFNY